MSHERELFRISELDVKGAGQLRVIIVNDIKSNYRHLLVEPFTWAWFGIQIAEGILAAVGGKIFSTIFGSDSLSKKDLYDVLQEFVQEVISLVQIQIQQEEIATFNNYASAIQSGFETYEVTKDTNYLVPLTMKSDDLISQYARFPYQTVGAFSIVGGLDLALLQESSLVATDPVQKAGYKKRLVSRAGELIQLGDQIEPALIQFNNSRFSFGVSNGGPQGYAAWEYRFEGQAWTLWPNGQIMTGSAAGLNPLYYPPSPNEPPVQSEAVARAWFQAAVDAQFKPLSQKILDPFYPIQDKWKQIAQG